MSTRITVATTVRVLTQLRRDPRTIALLLVVPSVLVFLLKEIFAGRPWVFQSIGAPVLGIFPFVSMFVVTSVTMLRERVSGTLERLMTMPLAKLDLLAGYGVAFALVAAVQATFVSLLALGVLGLEVQGPEWALRRSRRRERGSRHVARALRERVRANGVPGRPVHACPRPATDPPLWIDRRQGRDGGLAASRVGVPAADLRV